MTKTEAVQFLKYKILLNEIQQQTSFLEELHHKNMKCRNGCDLCCIDFSIFPVEFYFILSKLKKKNFETEIGQDSRNEICVFLKNGSCAIYQYRPIMCRTHGLPLLYANDNSEFELSACELNFTDFDFDDFTYENTLPQDKYNSKLFMLNREFVADFQDKKYSEMDLIPLKELRKHLLKTEK